jgi:thioredoxin reductase (NADPH)
MSLQPIADVAQPAVDPADPYARRAQTFPQLTEEQIERASEFGAVEALPRGTVLFRRGERAQDFFVVVEGAIEILDETPAGASVVASHGAREFTGDLDLFNDRRMLVGARMAETGLVLRIRRPSFRRLLAAEPDIAEIVMRAFILRRVGLMEHEQAATLLIGPRTSGDLLRLYRFLDHNGYPVRAVDPASEEGRTLVEMHRLGCDELPAAVIAHARVLRNPSNRDLAVAIGLSESLEPGLVHDVAIVGAGPAGLAAAVYSASEGLCTVVRSKPRPRADRPGRARRSRTTLAFRPGSRGRRWPDARWCRRRSSAPGSRCRAGSSACTASAGPTRSSSTTASWCARGAS